MPNSNQEAFNNAYRHHVLAGRPPGYDGENCRYYDQKTGAQCAIGCQLPDSKRFANVHSSLSGVASVANYREYADSTLTVELAKELLAHFEGCDFDFLCNLQNSHDDAAARSRGVYNFIPFEIGVKEGYEKLAADWNLQIPV